MSRWSSVIWPPPTSHPASSWISPLRLIPFVTLAVSHRPDEISPVPSSTFTTSRSPYAGGSFTAAFPGSSTLPWPSLRMTSSAPSFSRFRANISTLQDLLYATGCCFAPSSRRVTTLQRLLTTGCLLRGLLTVTTTGLAPVSRRWLFRTHHALLGVFVLQDSTCFEVADVSMCLTFSRLHYM